MKGQAHYLASVGFIWRTITYAIKARDIAKRRAAGETLFEEMNVSIAIQLSTGKEKHNS